METTSSWFCPRCSIEAKGITFQYLADSGIPYCTDCDCDMEFSHEEKINESLISAIVHNITLTLQSAKISKNWELVSSCIDRLNKL